ncbi:MAG: DUF2721 domain-containing protein [Planctomycetes bacterium]|nr:DUF2721 domain-containing protein [Planctomycetota bacterium]
MPDPSTAELWGKTISAAVVPVVMISACGLLCLGFYNRLTAILARMRALARETLEDQESLIPRKTMGDTQKFEARRARRTAAGRQQQADQLLRRAHLMRRAILCLLVAVAALVLASLCIGAGVLAPAALYAAAALFATGLACIFAGIVTAIAELGVALQSVTQEHELVGSLAKELEEAEHEATQGENRDGA